MFGLQRPRRAQSVDTVPQRDDEQADYREKAHADSNQPCQLRRAVASSGVSATHGQKRIFTRFHSSDDDPHLVHQLLTDVVRDLCLCRCEAGFPPSADRFRKLLKLPVRERR